MKNRYNIYYSLVSLSLLALSSLTPALAYGEGLDTLSSLYNPSVLFNQDAIAASHKKIFYNLDPESLMKVNDACKKEFVKHRTALCKKIVIGALPTVLSCLFPIVGFEIFALGYGLGKAYDTKEKLDHYLNHDFPIHAKQQDYDLNSTEYKLVAEKAFETAELEFKKNTILHSALASFALSPFTLGAVALMKFLKSDKIKQATEAFKLAYGWSPAFDVLSLLELEYASKKRFLNFLDQDKDTLLYASNKTIPYMESLFAAARTKTDNATSIAKTLRIFLDVPVISKKPTFNAEKALECFDLYSKETQEVIVRTCVNHMQSYQDTIGINKQSREFINFVSPPGVGKTYIARELAAIMDLPIETVCLSGGTIEKIFGSQTEPGLILEKLVQLRFRNGILFFDELDRIADDKNLLSILLPFLEPNEKKFYSPYLKRHIDVSHLLIMVAGNFSFKDAALNSRFHPLKTVNLDIENTPKFVQIVLEDYLSSKLSIAENELVSAQLKDEWYKTIVQYINKQEYKSFRDAQAKLDTLIGNWRIKELKLL